jgi:hypothetical protein
MLRLATANCPLGVYRSILLLGHVTVTGAENSREISPIGNVTVQEKGLFRAHRLPPTGPSSTRPPGLVFPTTPPHTHTHTHTQTRIHTLATHGEIIPSSLAAIVSQAPHPKTWPSTRPLRGPQTSCAVGLSAAPRARGGRRRRYGRGIGGDHAPVSAHGRLHRGGTVGEGGQQAEVAL